MDDMTDAYIDIWARSQGQLTDHWGNYFSRRCPACGAEKVEVLEAGVAVCTACMQKQYGQGGRKEL